MKIYLVLWALTYLPNSTPVIQEFETLEQCEAMNKYITQKHGFYRSHLCIAMDAAGKITESNVDQPGVKK